MIRTTTTASCDAQLADLLDHLAFALDRIACAIVDLGSDQRGLLVRRLRRLDADASLLVAELEQQTK